MAKLKDGTPVHVEFDGVTINEPWVGRMLQHPTMMDEGGCGGFIAVRDNDGLVHLIWNSGLFGLISPIIETEPDYWPPQVGDIWEANGAEYFVRRNRCVSTEVIVEATDNLVAPLSFWHHELEKFQALNPVLARRR